MLLVRDVTFSLRRTQGKASSGAGASQPVAGTLPSSFVQLSRNFVVLASLLVCSYDIQSYPESFHQQVQNVQLQTSTNYCIEIYLNKLTSPRERHKGQLF